MADINLGVGAANSASDAYEITNSLKLEADNNEWLYNASPTAGNRQTYTFSFWIKRSGLGTVNASGTAYVIGAGQHGRMYFGSDFFQYRFDDGHDCRNMSRKFRDPSAWYHFVVAVDTTIASPSSDRVKLYVNGESLEVDDHDGGSFPDQNDQGAFFSTNYLTIGTAAFGGSYNAGDGDYDMRGYLAEFCGVDGQQLAPTDFGKYDSNGIWIPKDVSNINFGSEGFYLKFDDTSSSGKDSSGNGNNFSDSNLSAADHATDTPTNNFCTLNLPVSTYINTMGAIEGGTYMKRDGQNNFAGFFGTLGFTKGKWYFESYIPSRSASYGLMEEMGIHTLGSITLGSPYYVTQMETNYYLNFHYGYTYHWNNGTRVSRAWADTGIPDLGPSAVGSWIGFAINADDGEATWYKDGSQMGTADLDMFDIHDKMQDGVFAVPFFQVYDNNLKVNFGGYSSQAISSGNADANGYGNFEYAVPSGYYAICTKNLAEYG